MSEERIFVDARGVRIEPGATVVYGAGVGRSIAMVEAEVVDFTPAGNVKLRVIRRSFGGYGGREHVSVMPDRLVVVDSLPESPFMTQAEQVAQRERRWRDLGLA